MYRSVLIAIALGCSSVVSAGESAVWIKSGFVTGTQFRAFSNEARRAYAMGVMDGMFLSPFFDAKKEKLEWLERCATGMSDEQIVAIFDKYLRDNPGRWHEPMHTLGWIAMKDACGK